MGADKNNKQSWIANIQEGDEQSFELLFKKYYLSLSRFAWRYVKSKAVAEELVQDIFADIWDERAGWAPRESLEAYLYQTVRNRALDYLRHQKVRQEYDPEWMANKENPTINFKDNRREERIRRAIQREIENLPSRSKMTFKLHRYDGLTYKEIAEVMDVSVKTVESQMTRTLKRLRERLSYLLSLILTMALSFML